jgi:hypothetical protein
MPRINPSDSDSKLKPTIRSGSPQSFGWLRRPECDLCTPLSRCVIGEAWEKPDGELYLHNPRDGRLIVSCVRNP